MANVFDYLHWRGDLTFEQAPQNEVDLLIFSLLSYIDYADYVPAGFVDGAGISLQAAANAFSHSRMTWRGVYRRKLLLSVACRKSKWKK